MGRLTFRVLIYVAVSFVDLVTTLALLGTGRAIEGNPIAALFAHDPLLLCLFKLTTTALVVVVAYRLARYHRHLAETAMAVAAAFTILVVVFGLSTVPPPALAKG